MKGKLIIFSAPSGAGKTTIVRRMLNKNLDLEFSISATSRQKREEEKDGVDYYFMTTNDFREKIKNGEFVEWEEVYPNHYYGTLKSEVDRIRANGKNVVFDVDVIGGLNIKKVYWDEALAIFVMPPSIEELENRLIVRSSEDPAKIKLRISKAESELKYAPKFDKIIHNDDLDKAVEEAEKIILNFINA
jgi:guanylate kinase